MSTDFTVIQAVRQFFGDRSIRGDNYWLPEWGIFVGNEKDFGFDCPEVDASQHAVLQLQVLGVDGAGVFQINQRDLPGGLKSGPSSDGITINGRGFALWSTQSLLVEPNVLTSTGNTLHIAAAINPYLKAYDDFAIDNVVLFYKLRSGIVDDGRGGPQIGGVHA